MSAPTRPLTRAEQARVERARVDVENMAFTNAGDFPSADRGLLAEEMAQAGMVKLAEIAPHFNPLIQEDFKAFWYHPVRGAMLEVGIGEAKLSARERAIRRAGQKVGSGGESREELMASMIAGDGGSRDKRTLRAHVQARAAAMLWSTQFAAPPQDPETMLVLREEYTLAMKCLNSAEAALEPRAKLVLDLIYRRDLTNDQAGAQIDGGVDGKTVQRAHKRAREGLAAALEAAGIVRAPDVVDGAEP